MKKGMRLRKILKNLSRPRKPPNVKARARIGVFGGSGLYRFFDKAEELSIQTPYGKTSAPVTLSKIGDEEVAFLPSHGVYHEYPPHVLPYRANLHAFKELGVERVIGPSAVGSLRPQLRPGDFVFCDQFVNFTSGRRDTFFDGPTTTHISSADPYCNQMRKVGLFAAKKLKLSVHDSGTVVVVNGPRFSTRSESKFFKSQGWDVINMTQYPEVVLAREMEMCYLNISLVTDYDVGLEGDPDAKPVSHEDVLQVFERNTAKLRDLIIQICKTLPNKRTCGCGTTLEHSRVSA
jgi:5'-methylthioadenosine phosphorylase